MIVQTKEKIPNEKKEKLHDDSQLQKNKKSMSIDFSKFTPFLSIVKNFLYSIYDFITDNKNNSKIMIVIAGITCWLAIYFGMQLYNDIAVLDQKSSQLANLSNYDTSILASDASTKNILKSADTIQDMLQENQNLQWEISKYTDYLQALQIPYTYLLKYIYLPSLNIWKENYTNNIDTNLIWIKFLEKNPYNDITLLQKRGDFFKSLGDNNEFNDIVDMKIGDFTEDDKWFFSMPITVSFVANSKRAFLLLSDKLSMTSNKENISLINEFFYYLRGEIKKGKEKEIKALENNYSTIFGSGQEIDQDKMIGYHIYNWIFNNKKNTLIDDTIIDKTIKSIVSCNNESDEVCYYRFRERYRNIPTFGYLLGTNFGTNGAENLRKFIMQLPPIFSIQQFEFDKIKSPIISDAINSKYQGKVTILVYWRSASAQDVDEIAQTLGAKCLWSSQVLSLENGLNIIQEAIVKLSDVNRINQNYGDNLWELKWLIEQLAQEYPKLSNYKKTIKLFELYRMLSDSGLCK